MKLPTLLLLAAALTSSPAWARDRLVDGFPELPEDARVVAERSVACQHFQGEVMGDGGARDQEVDVELGRLGCDRIEADLQRIRYAYRRDPGILEILKEAEHE